MKLGGGGGGMGHTALGLVPEGKGKNGAYTTNKHTQTGNNPDWVVSSMQCRSWAISYVYQRKKEVLGVHRLVVLKGGGGAST